jgi:hypothetical protein
MLNDKSLQPDVHQFQYYFVDEVEKKLDAIETSIKDSSSEESNREIINKILNSCEAIEDLASVYGYEGIEALSRNLSIKMKTLLGSKKNISPQITENIIKILITIHQLIDTDEGESVNQLISQALEQIVESDMTPETARIAVKQSQQKSTPPKIKQPKLSVEDSTPQVIKIVKPLFDIKEADSIMDLIQLIEDNNRKNEKSSVASATLMSQQPVSEKAKAIEQIFNDIFVEETKENLDFIKKYVELAKQGVALGETIMRLKEACSSLKDTAHSFNLKEVQDSLNLLNQVAKNRLNFNAPPDSTVLDTIKETEYLVRNYIDQKEADFSHINEKLKLILSLPDTYEGDDAIDLSTDDSSDEIKVIYNI